MACLESATASESAKQGAREELLKLAAAFDAVQAKTKAEG
jgi:hypothetical protein